MCTIQLVYHPTHAHHPIHAQYPAHVRNPTHVHHPAHVQYPTLAARTGLEKEEAFLVAEEAAKEAASFKKGEGSFQAFKARESTTKKAIDAGHRTVPPPMYPPFPSPVSY